MSEADNGDKAWFLFRELTVDPGQTPVRIDRFLSDKLESASRTFLQRALGEQLIEVNDAPVKSSYRVKPGDVIRIFQDTPPREKEPQPEDIPLSIVYEDDYLLVLNKPAGMVVHPGHGHFSGTLINALLYYFRNLPLFQEGGLRPGLAHRIDKDTSGLLAVGKTAAAMEALGRIFLSREAHREYLALVWGRFEEPEGSIETNLARDPANRQRMKAFECNGSIGKYAKTNWRLLQDFTFTSLVSCQLETGRMHQIRVHMASEGHPLFADARYGGDEILRGVPTAEYRDFIHRCFATCPRQALHAHKLALPHPISGEALAFTAPLPDDFRGLLDMWESFSPA